METLKLPEKTRLTLGELYKVQQQAIKEFQLVAGAALDFLGLDPNLPHSINFDSGIVVPATAPTPLSVVNDKSNEATG